MFLTQIDEVVSRSFIVSLELCCLGDFTKCNNFSFVQLQHLIVKSIASYATAYKQPLTSRSLELRVLLMTKLAEVLSGLLKKRL